MDDPMSKKTNFDEDIEIPEKCPTPSMPNIHDIIDNKEKIIKKKAKVSWDGRQYIVRFPTQIANEMDVSKGNEVCFTVIIHPTSKGTEKKMLMEFL